eukprot:TRINITY_DN91125_c0_g1_i1.p1 TRINITY_DN91125_c0_g1~~TRINITY_DN91125_c0_g1_i1.p1  ORF type:complete len:152 (+),score=30.29 TRINITY_DN91125_c0_g1_i1:48-458(+)
MASPSSLRPRLRSLLITGLMLLTILALTDVRPPAADVDKDVAFAPPPRPGSEETKQAQFNRFKQRFRRVAAPVTTAAPVGEVTGWVFIFFYILHVCLFIATMEHARTSFGASVGQPLTNLPGVSLVLEGLGGRTFQ